MNIIAAVRQLLTECELIKPFTGNIQIDFTSNQDGEFGLFSNGDNKIREDILGNQTRQHNFVLYATHQSQNEFERLQNSEFLLNLSYWLESVKGQKLETVIDGKTYSGEITKMWSANGMAYSIPPNNADGVTYQLQIYAQYKLKKE